MNDQPVELSNLNEAFAKALINQFFEPVLTGRGPNGEAFYAQSGVSIMAQDLFKQHARLIMEEVWERLDMDVLAAKIADLVVAELIRTPSTYNPNPHQKDLVKRVKEIVAQSLGKRVVDQMDLQIGPKEIGEKESQDVE